MKDNFPELLFGLAAGMELRVKAKCPLSLEETSDIACALWECAVALHVQQKVAAIVAVPVPGSNVVALRGVVR